MSPGIRVAWSAGMRLLLVSAIALTACSSYGRRDAREVAVDPFGPIPSGMAQVCVVRPPGRGQLLATTFRDNGVTVGMTRGPSFFCYFAAPGNHRITPGNSDEAIATLDVTAGRRYVLRHQANVGEDEILWVDPTARESLFSECEALELSTVASR